MFSHQCPIDQFLHLLRFGVIANIAASEVLHYLRIVGAEFRGVVWRRDRESVPWAVQVRRLESNLKSYAVELGSAVPVNWIRTKNPRPYSAICSEKTLFVVLLNPEYFGGRKASKKLKLSINDELQEGYIELFPPSGVSIVSGATISGMPIDVHDEDDRLLAKYKFKNAGEILIFNLNRKSVAESIQSKDEPENNIGS